MGDVLIYSAVGECIFNARGFCKLSSTGVTILIEKHIIAFVCGHTDDAVFPLTLNSHVCKKVFGDIIV